MSPIELSWTAKNESGNMQSISDQRVLVQCQHVREELPTQFTLIVTSQRPLVAGAWTERKKMFHGGSFLKLADDNMDIQNPEAQNRELSGF